jgi:hypothetical protein
MLDISRVAAAAAAAQLLRGTHLSLRMQRLDLGYKFPFDHPLV